MAMVEDPLAFLHPTSFRKGEAPGKVVTAMMPRLPELAPLKKEKEGTQNDEDGVGGGSLAKPGEVGREVVAQCPMRGRHLDRA